MACCVDMNEFVGHRNSAVRRAKIDPDHYSKLRARTIFYDPGEKGRGSVRSRKLEIPSGQPTTSMVMKLATSIIDSGSRMEAELPTATIAPDV